MRTTWLRGGPLNQVALPVLRTVAASVNGRSGINCGTVPTTANSAWKRYDSGISHHFVSDCGAARRIGALGLHQEQRDGGIDGVEVSQHDVWDDKGVHRQGQRPRRVLRFDPEIGLVLEHQAGVSHQRQQPPALKVLRPPAQPVEHHLRRHHRDAAGFQYPIHLAERSQLVGDPAEVFNRRRQNTKSNVASGASSARPFIRLTSR
jgi:hypothetical protein